MFPFHVLPSWHLATFSSQDCMILSPVCQKPQHGHNNFEKVDTCLFQCRVYCEINSRKEVVASLAGQGWFLVQTFKLRAKVNKGACHQMTSAFVPPAPPTQSRAAACKGQKVQKTERAMHDVGVIVLTVSCGQVHSIEISHI